MPFDADQILFDAAWKTLPDQTLAEQKRILKALRVRLLPTHPAHRNVCVQLAAIGMLESLQAELPFKTNPEAK